MVYSTLEAWFGKDISYIDTGAKNITKFLRGILKMKVTLINYSGRVGNGNCSSIVSYIEELLSVSYEVIKLKLSNYNIYRCNRCQYSCSKKFSNGKCKHTDDIQLLYNKIMESTIVINVIPIYCNLPCSNYFAFRERAQSAFLSDDEYKKYQNTLQKVIVIGNTPSTSKLKVIFDDIVKSKKDILLLSPNKFKKIAFYGNMLQSINAQKELNDYIKQCFNT